MSDINEMRLAATQHALQHMTQEQQSKYCVLLGSRVVKSFDTQQEATEMIAKAPQLDLVLYVPLSTLL